MALAFEAKKVGTLRAKGVDGKFVNVAGVNPEESDPENYAGQVNKILSLGGKAIVADLDMTVETKKGVVDVG